MKKNRKPKSAKLVLAKRTLRKLAAQEVHAVVGGTAPSALEGTCWVC